VFADTWIAVPADTEVTAKFVNEVQANPVVELVVKACPAEPGCDKKPVVSRPVCMSIEEPAPDAPPTTLVALVAVPLKLVAVIVPVDAVTVIVVVAPSAAEPLAALPKYKKLVPAPTEVVIPTRFAVVAVPLKLIAVIVPVLASAVIKVVAPKATEPLAALPKYIKLEPAPTEVVIPTLVAVVAVPAKVAVIVPVLAATVINVVEPKAPLPLAVLPKYKKLVPAPT
jgi:hypothetical protein